MTQVGTFPEAEKAARSDRAAWRTLAILSVAIVLSMTTWFSATAIVTELRAVWRLDGVEAAWLTNAVQIGFVFGALSSSLFNLPDMISARTLMASAAVLAAAGNAILLVAPSAEVAIGARFVTGVALAGVYPPALKLISTWFVRGRGLALGCVIAALTLGSAFPHLLRAVTSTLDWRLVVASTSAMTVFGALLMARFALEGPTPYPRAVFDLKQIGRVLRNRPVALANVGYFGHMWELYAMWGWFLAFAQAYRSANGADATSAASLITFVVIASGAVGCILGGLLADRVGRTATTALMMAISAACCLLIGLVFHGPLWLFLLVATVWGASVVADSAQFSAVVTEVGEAAFVGTALALQLGLGFALTAFAIAAVPAFADWVGWQWAFVVLAPGPVVGAWAMLKLRRMPEARKIAQGRR
ncbi:MFS transporter [Hansschlegelia sp. KR7-227]|jgi:MFS family permease|uniref:MFS transporter n=1 Tax=Hansschlegelia sp. KR7-227 TaxID=3400914 RepID=UPI003C129491